MKISFPNFSMLGFLLSVRSLTGLRNLLGLLCQSLTRLFFLLKPCLVFNLWEPYQAHNLARLRTLLSPFLWSFAGPFFCQNFDEFLITRALLGSEPCQFLFVGVLLDFFLLNLAGFKIILSLAGLWNFIGFLLC